MRKIIAGNWKMHKTLKESEGYMKVLLSGLSREVECRILLAPSFPLLVPMVSWARQSAIEIGAQNIHDQEEGAFTGEVSAQLVKEIGASFVLVGHSERRHLFNENSVWIGKKVKRALAVSLQPVLCIGETLEEREKGLTQTILTRQLLDGLGSLSLEELFQVIIAYEPVWAIGTGKVATPEMAEDAHLFCRAQIAKKWGEAAAIKIPILYGGSVKSETMKGLMVQKNIDGVLVGGASLAPDSFLQIIQYQ